MLKQQLKRKLKSVFKSFTDVCEETAKLIDGKYQEMTSKMWEIGKIIAEKRKEVDPKYGDKFIPGIAEKMKSEPTIIHLHNCEKLYCRYPDINVRTLKTGLTPTHYQILSVVPEKKDRERFEKVAKKEDLTTTELRERIYPPLPEPKPEKKTPNDWVYMMVDKGMEMREWLSEPCVISQLTKTQRNRLTKSLEDLRESIDSFLDSMETMP